MKALLESSELLVSKPLPLSGIELKKAHDSADALLLMHDFRKADDFSPESVKEFISKLKPFQYLTFVKETISTLEDMLSTHTKMLHAVQKFKGMGPEISAAKQSMMDAFKSGDRQALRKHSATVQKIVDDLSHDVNLPEAVKRHLKSSLTAEPTIFGTTRLLDTLGDSDYEEIRKINFNEPVFSPMEFPTRKQDDLHYVVNFLKHISNSPKPKRIGTGHEVQLFTKGAYANNGKLDALHTMVDKYLNSNDKSLIPKITAAINNIPHLKFANMQAKKKIHVVYRGVPVLNDESIDDVLEHDKQQQFVATSTSSHTAKNFAMMKGHLEHEDSRRADLGFIIEYHVTPEAVLFDTDVLGGVFNEREVLIDVSKAKFEGYKEV